MRRSLAVWAAFVFVFAGVIDATRCQEPEFPRKPPATRASSEEDVAVRLFRSAAPSVVAVVAYDAKDNKLATGSGFFLTSDVVVTNLHVTKGADSVSVRLPSKEEMRVIGVVGFDSNADIILFKVDGSSKHVLRLSTELPPVGTRVYAIGSPRGLTNTLSEGLISGQRELGEGIIALQTSAPISPGSSGGPLLTRDARVVGITTASFLESQNLNLAIAAASIQKLADEDKQPVTLAEANKLSSAVEPHLVTVADAPQQLAAVWREAKQDRFAKATLLLSQIPESHHGAGYWSARGYVLLWQGIYDEAYAAYRKSYALDPHADTLTHLALTCLSNFDDTWRVDEAIAAAKAATEMAPQSAEAYNILGISYTENPGATLESREPQMKGLAALRLAVELDPEHVASRYNLAIVYLKLKEYAKATNEFNAVQDLLQNEAQCRKIIFSNATPTPISQWSKNESLLVLAYFGLARAYARTNQNEREAETYRKILAVEPSNGKAYAGLGMCRRGETGRLDDPLAKEYLQKAKTLDADCLSVIFFASQSPWLVSK
jgi:tetratricopeptide (TPR) repeat protein